MLDDRNNSHRDYNDKSTSSILSKHIVGRIILDHIEDVDYLLSVHQEAELGDEIHESIKKIFTEIEKLVNNSNVIECQSDILNSNQCHFSLNIALNLQFFPEESVPTLVDFYKKSCSLELNKLQNEVLEVDNIEETIESNSPLEWFAFYQSFFDNVKGISGQKDILCDIINYFLIQDDFDLRKQQAVQWITDRKDRLKYFSEFGDNIPVEFFDSLVINSGATLFGYSLSVGCINNAYQSFTICDFKSDSTRNPCNRFSDLEVIWTYNEGRVYITRSLKTAQKVVQFLDNEKSLSSQTVSLELPTIKDRLVFKERNLHSFIGQSFRKPIVLTKRRLGVIDSINFFKKSSNGQCAGIRFKEMGAKPINMYFNKEIPVDRRTVKSFDEEVRNLSIDSYFLTFNNRFSVILFSQPTPKLYNKDILIDSNQAHRGYKIYGLMSNLGSAPWIPIIKKPVLRVSDERYENSEVSFDFSFIESLEMGKPINRHKLEFGYDPLLDVACDENGNNALIDRWNISIPIVKPLDEDFNLPQFNPIKGLVNIPQKLWRGYLDSIEGDWLNELNLVNKEHKISGAKSTRRTSLHDLKDEPPVIGDCYKAPRENISIFGSWIISHCKIGNKNFFILDSPLYGAALYLFRYLKSAELAAEHFEANGKRQDAIRLPGYIKKIVHSEGWEMRLADTVKKYVLD